MTRNDLRRACAAPCDHPELGDLRRDAQQVVDWALNDFTLLPFRSVGRSASAVEMSARLHEPPPEGPTPFADILHQFDVDVCGYSIRVHHPRFLAFVPSAPTLVSVMGDWLASAANFFAGVWVEGAGPAQVELTVLDWFRELLGMPAGASGLLTSGGSDANLTALLAARALLSVEDRPRAVLYVSQQRHWSIDRAAGIIGLLPDQIRPVAVDEGHRLCLAALRQAITDDRAVGRVPWTVVATAGTTNTGAIDPLRELVALCRASGLWLHIDAAYGWANMLDPDGAAELAGIGQADSITLDPHKWLAQGFEVGALLVRDPKALERAFTLRPEYLEDVAPQAGEVNFCDRGIALTRRCRALKVWLSVKVLGLGWYRRMVTHTRTLARYAAHVLSEAGFEVVSVRMSIVCFTRPGLDDDGHRTMLQRVRQSGEAFLSSTRLGGRVVLRFCFVNWRTTASDVDQVIGLLR